MRILIAEDELLERKAMRKFIKENFADMVVVGEAVNGRMAIELAGTTSPDLIFMDIKMPGINGLEAIKKINTAYPAIKFILVSAYDSFDYAKEAMQFGIKDYILKPGKKEEIVKALLRVQKEMKLERAEKEQSINLLKERFMTKLMQSPLPEDMTALQSTLFPTMKSGCFFVLKSGSNFQLEAIEQAMAAHSMYPFILLQTEEVSVVCVIAATTIEKAEVLVLARKLQIALGNDLYIGIGFPADALEKLAISYRDAYAASLQLASADGRHYGFLQTTDKNATQAKSIVNISNLVEKGDRDEAIINYKSCQNALTDQEKEDLYIQIKNSMTTRNISISNSTFSTVQTEQDWLAFIHVCCMKMNEFHQSKQYIAQAKQYIQAHFTETITLEDVAAIVKLSPNYFSNIFKQELGQTFIDFLTKVRMQKAKELMERHTHSLKEISFMVGYKDPNYFSRVFKKYYHESPKQFQQGIFNK